MARFVLVNFNWLFMHSFLSNCPWIVFQHKLSYKSYIYFHHHFVNLTKYKAARKLKYRVNGTGSYKIVQIFCDIHSKYYRKVQGLNFCFTIWHTQIQHTVRTKGINKRFYLHVKGFYPNSCLFLFQWKSMYSCKLKILIIYRFTAINYSLAVKHKPCGLRGAPGTYRLRAFLCPQSSSSWHVSLPLWCS